MHLLLASLPPLIQALAHELYVLDANVHAIPESCYSMHPPADGVAEAAYVLRGVGQVVNFREKSDVLLQNLHAAACTRWDLTCDEDGRLAVVVLQLLAP